MPDPIVFAKDFATRFGCRVLIDRTSEPHNPFARHLVTGNGRVRCVHLDDEPMARSPEQYVIAR